MKHYSSLTDSNTEWIGKYPAHWKITRLKYVSSINPSKERAVKYRASNMDAVFLPMEKVNSDGTFDNGTTKSIQELWNGFTYFQEGDVIFAKITPCFENGKGALIRNLGSPIGFGSTEFHVLRAVADVSISEFLYYLTKSSPFRKVGEGYMQGVAGQKRVTSSFLDNFVLVLPSLSEQTAIAQYLDRKTYQIDDLIANKRCLIELLKEEQTAVISQAVTKGLDSGAKAKDSGIEWIGTIPRHWVIKKLKYLVKGKLKYGANEATELSEEGLPRYIRITDFDEDGYLRSDTFRSLPMEIAREYLLHDGDILFARSGATVGKTFQYKHEKGTACFAGYLVRAIPDKTQILSDFLYHYTRSSSYENWKNSIFIQATIQNIGADKYQMLHIPVPPLSEQHEIIAFLKKATSRTEAAILKVRREIELLEEYRAALVSEVVTGKIDVRDEVME
jgi:restriction endonuclease S subunit